MKTEESENKVSEPYTEYGRYSYADYLTWQMDEMVEIIKGKVFKPAAAAPRRIHQEVTLKVARKFADYLDQKPCKIFIAPFDVRLPIKSKKNEDIFTVVQPDICVVCDRSKLDEAGCIGAPDLIIEILSPGSNRKELKYKYEVYEESGVKEYWVIQPTEQTLLIYTLIAGKYVPSRLFSPGDIVSSACIKGFSLDLEDVFKDLD
ncbi:Uma2 family endonuclease [Aquiflexum sp. LQ15W]|uniref:Uma2 family endonuclease n=1 Tax=Cognataquiflexum nitidum TaxID=2922272 RepID=UPI001F133DAE|nr:Uma2 family endonuclease [Cognataquiflexum nitidum]MCH6200318.1 Uma2 family endonuclease [Cognataquiflexum nitidum]